jgi:hypothetical protein
MGVDVVGKGKKALGIARVVLENALHHDVSPCPLEVDGVVDWLLLGVQIGDEVL